MAPRDLHPLVIALMEAWARRAGYDPDDVWRYLRREATPPDRFVDDAVEAFWPRVRPEDFLALPSRSDDATVATKTASVESQTREQRVSRSRLTRANRKHPFVAALVDKGLTVTEVAVDLGYGRSTVQSWYDARPENARPIPRAAAEAIKARLGVPLSTWRKIVD